MLILKEIDSVVVDGERRISIKIDVKINFRYSETASSSTEERIGEA